VNKKDLRQWVDQEHGPETWVFSNRLAPEDFPDGTPAAVREALDRLWGQAAADLRVFTDWLNADESTAGEGDGPAGDPPGWQPDGSGVQPGGAAGLGGSYRVRFRHPGLRGALITRTAYAAAEPGGTWFTVKVETRLSLHGDPERPGTETWSHVTTRAHGDVRRRRGPETAEAAARQAAHELAGEAWRIDWDGTPRPPLPR
jgi:hypothetical protein